MPALLRSATLRSLFVLFGLSYTLVSLSVACLDYAGEDFASMPNSCDAGSTPGSGSAASQIPDCDAAAPSGSGSGSGS